MFKKHFLKEALCLKSTFFGATYKLLLFLLEKSTFFGKKNFNWKKNFLLKNNFFGTTNTYPLKLFLHFIYKTRPVWEVPLPLAIFWPFLLSTELNFVVCSVPSFANISLTGAREKQYTCASCMARVTPPWRMLFLDISKLKVI